MVIMKYIQGDPKTGDLVYMAKMRGLITFLSKKIYPGKCWDSRGQENIIWDSKTNLQKKYLNIKLKK